MAVTADTVRQKLQRLDDLCTQGSLPIAQVNEVHGVMVPTTEGGTGQVAIVLVCEPKPSKPWQPKLKPEFAFFEQFVGCDGIMEAQESWHDCQFEPDDHQNALWKRYATPADAVCEIVDTVIRDAKEKERTASYVQRVLNEASGPEGAHFYTKLVVQSDAATRHSLVRRSAGWLAGLHWKQCFYSQSNRPSLSSWSGSPWEYDNVLSKLLPGVKNKLGIELAVSDCADEALQKKYGLATWRRAHFRDVPEKFIVTLRQDGVEPATCQAFWHLLEQPATGTSTAASSDGKGKGKRRDVSPSPATGTASGAGAGAKKKQKSVTQSSMSQSSMKAFLSR